MEQSEHKYQRLDLRPHHQCGRKRSAVGDNQRPHRLLGAAETTRGTKGTEYYVPFVPLVVSACFTIQARMKRLFALSLVAGVLAQSCNSATRVKQNPTFNENIAPIVFKNCAPCHRPG